MFTNRISDYFEGVAAKYLSAVDADPSRSNQHEIGGLPSVGFKKYLGTPSKDQKVFFLARMAYVADDEPESELCESEVTWYDSRHRDPKRSPEYRLYYKSNPVTARLAEGDFFLVAKLRNGPLLMVFAPQGSTTELQLRMLFGLGIVDEELRAGIVGGEELLLPLRLLLEDVGVVFRVEEDRRKIWLKRIIERFGDTGFPGTSSFSKFARETIEEKIDPLMDPDKAIVAWMDHEEVLFRILEGHLVQRKLQKGFGESGDDVDEFISFSLSVQNRRKSRVGHAFESHLDALFRIHGVRFEQGRGKERVTENNSKPDFLFPDFQSYHSTSYPADALRMLGAKTTCKDRWRQVLSEAKKIGKKHLVTLEAAISEAQTGEMRDHGLQLIVPQPILETYSEMQRSWVINLGQFIDELKDLQAHS
jgi:hypothetical protein